MSFPLCYTCGKKRATVRSAVRLPDDYDSPEFTEAGRKYGVAYLDCGACWRTVRSKQNQVERLGRA